jgi:hypothetical protein
MVLLSGTVIPGKMEIYGRRCCLVIEEESRVFSHAEYRFPENKKHHPSEIVLILLYVAS